MTLLLLRYSKIDWFTRESSLTCSSRTSSLFPWQQRLKYDSIIFTQSCALDTQKNSIQSKQAQVLNTDKYCRSREIDRTITVVHFCLFARSLETSHPLRSSMAASLGASMDRMGQLQHSILLLASWDGLANCKSKY